MNYRWQFQTDPNFDGVLSISDVWLWIKWFYFAPGDLIIFLISKVEPLRIFFELSPQSYGNWFSAVVGMPFTLAAALIVVMLINDS